MPPERDMATRLHGRHLKMMRIVTQISSVAMAALKVKEISRDLNQLFSKTRIPSRLQRMALLSSFKSLFPESIVVRPESHLDSN